MKKTKLFIEKLIVKMIAKKLNVSFYQALAAYRY